MNEIIKVFPYVPIAGTVNESVTPGTPIRIHRAVRVDHEYVYTLVTDGPKFDVTVIEEN